MYIVDLTETQTAAERRHRAVSSEASDTPRPARSLDRQVVLEEDEYTEALSQIIARDFFPSLVHLDATNNYLDALRSDDPQLIQALPTPLRTPRSERGEPAAKRARFDTDMSLDAFTQILADENRQRQERYGWAWAAQRRLAVVYEDDEEEVEDSLMGRMLLVPRLRQSRALLSQDADVLAPKKDTRSAGVDGWEFKASASATEPKGAPKAIKHGNTRLPQQDDNLDHSLSAPPSPTRSRIDAAIAGTPCEHSSLRSVLEISTSALRSPRSPSNSSHPLVPSVPSPTPSELGPAAVKQLMTWGTLNATPRVLSQSDDPVDFPTPATPFRIAEPSSRERLSHKMSTDAAKSLRAKAGLLSGMPLLSRSSAGSRARRTSMPPPSFTPRKSDAPGSLTPAAKRLLDRTTMGTAASRRADAMGRLAGWEGDRKERDLQRVRWTPTPSPVTRRA
ncbi:nuclear protein Es2-domain-containing protein [Epithele typhae]|uniref:nuclear protein Es2-domain-containing protein n=1 Tax=Epithele typhae TaxID=378194 RepID=UPI002008C305|nr:nuclear protein Es2-domain-containing protein [Epithele typhae]KAH9944095.1 nuclear protein Es2-domain-containing protein [Epithele typhae]